MSLQLGMSSSGQTRRSMDSPFKPGNDKDLEPGHEEDLAPGHD
ncbi:MAG: hypothetical protein RL559_778 [Pseudomonadota bacterium]|jgi:hypothetical protein